LLTKGEKKKEGFSGQRGKGKDNLGEEKEVFTPSAGKKRTGEGCETGQERRKGRPGPPRESKGGLSRHRGKGDQKKEEGENRLPAFPKDEKGEKRREEEKCVMLLGGPSGRGEEAAREPRPETIT